MSTAVSTRPQHTVRSLLANASVMDQLAAALPRFFKPEQFAVIVRTAINRNPKLEECTPESFMVSILTAAQMGIPCDGRNGHLIPRKNKAKGGIMECSFQADYKGLIRLVRMNDDVADIYAVNVHEGDKFELRQGLHRDLVHEPNPFDAERRKIVGAYAVLKYKDGTSAFEWMSWREIEDIRDRSDGWKAYKAGFINSTPWLTDEGEMSKKTVLKRLLKTADLNPDTAQRLDVESEVHRVDLMPTPTIARPTIGGAETAALPAGNGAQHDEPQAGQEQTKARVATRPAKRAQAVEVQPTPTQRATPAEEEAPLPGAEAIEPPITPYQAIREVAEGYTDAQILKVLVAYRMAEPHMTKLEDVPSVKIVEALTDTATFKGELADLK